MRVIAGRFRSRKLNSVPGLAVRPTPERLRESLFSILAPRIEGATFIDAYAGSGAVGIEAFSRGAKHVFLIERNAQALSVIRENLDSLGITKEVTVLRGRAASLLTNHPADIVFLDPPYDKVSEYSESLLALAQIRCPYAVAQHASRLTLDDSYGNLSRTRLLKQGDNSLSFFEPLEGNQ
jgi:16S rRNA (guanine(966)-N(2))-methyltransferase RsmD